MFQLKRFPHVIQDKKRTVTPSNFVFFDCETKLKGSTNAQGIGKHVLWFGYAYAYRMEKGKRTREVWFRFTTGEQFFSFLKTRLYENIPLYVYAHNLAFDLTIVGFFERYKRLGINIGFYTIESPPTIFKCQWDKKTITFVDTLNYWTVSLAKLAKSIGREKLDMPISKSNRQLWDTYCRNDVDIISDAITNLCRFVSDHNCGSVGLTLASLSMNAYRRGHMEHDIFIHDRLRVCELERESYYGGLVQCMYLGKLNSQKYYNVDINSHYPAVMRNPMPTKLVEELDNVNVDKLKQRMKKYLCIARVLINTRSETFPVKHKKKLLYAIGRFRTTLSHPELERAIQANAIIAVEKVACYEGAKIFTSFINYFWHVRQKYIKEEREVDAYFCKILLNSLYGKFGQRGVAWVDLTPDIMRHIRHIHNIPDSVKEIDPKQYPVETIGYESWTPEGFNEELYLRNILNGLQVRIPIGEHHESFPAIAAFVTAYGREFLLNLMEIAGKRNCYYCDTDSLFVNEKGLRALKKARLIQPTELGKLKIERESKTLEIRGLKDYTFGEVSKTKGVRKDAIKLSDDTYWQVQFEGLRGILRRGGKAFVEIKEILKTFNRDYDKGIRGKDGWVSPLILREF